MRIEGARPSNEALTVHSHAPLAEQVPECAGAVSRTSRAVSQGIYLGDPTIVPSDTIQRENDCTVKPAMSEVPATCRLRGVPAFSFCSSCKLHLCTLRFTRSVKTCTKCLERRRKVNSVVPGTDPFLEQHCSSCKKVKFSCEFFFNRKTCISCTYKRANRRVGLRKEEVAATAFSTEMEDANVRGELH